MIQYSEAPTFHDLPGLNPHFTPQEWPYVFVELDQTDENDDPIAPFTYSLNVEGLRYIKTTDEALIIEKTVEIADIENLLTVIEPYMPEDPNA